MKPLAARPEVFGNAPLAFVRPLGVDPLTPAQADASLITQLRAELRHRDEQIEALQSRPALRLVRTFDDMTASFATVAMLCIGIRSLGKEPVMEWHGDLDGKVWLTVSIAA